MNDAELRPPDVERLTQEWLARVEPERARRAHAPAFHMRRIHRCRDAFWVDAEGGYPECIESSNERRHGRRRAASAPNNVALMLSGVAITTNAHTRGIDNQTPGSLRNEHIGLEEVADGILEYRLLPDAARKDRRTKPIDHRGLNDQL